MNQALCNYAGFYKGIEISDKGHSRPGYYWISLVNGKSIFDLPGDAPVTIYVMRSILMEKEQSAEALKDSPRDPLKFERKWEAIQQESPVTAAEFVGQCQQHVIAFFNGIKYTRSWL